MSRFLNGVALAALLSLPAEAGQLGLGRAAAPDEIAAWDIDIRPDGAGLPVGRGSVADGEEIFTERCAACHGDFGEGRDRWPALAGGQGTLTHDRPLKTVGSYWPYLSTVWDYVHRAKPFGDAQSLTDDEVYGITAYLLYLNDLVDDEFELSDENFSEIRMPNAQNFVADPRPDTPLAPDAGLCMQKCKETVEITMRTAALDVTPEDGQNPSGLVVSAVQTQPVVTQESAAADPAVVAEGERVYRKCRACHQVGDGARNRVGPHLNGVMGRVAGTAAGYRYSGAMVSTGESGLVWTTETLDAFLADPRSYVPETKMLFEGLRESGDRTAIITYLSQFRD